MNAFTIDFFVNPDRAVTIARSLTRPPLSGASETAPMHPWQVAESRLMRAVRLAAASLGLALVAACGSLLPKAVPPPAFYALEGRSAPGPAISPAPHAADLSAISKAPTLVVYSPQAAAGFDSSRIIFQREPHSHAAFAQSVWVDTPARMLSPLIVAALQAQGGYRAVLSAPSAVTGDLRLDTELLRLQHEFGVVPSRVHLTLRATLVDTRSRQVVAMRVFDQTLPSQTEDAYGGVVAANAAVQALLDQLALFCGEAAARWQTSADTRALVLPVGARASDVAARARAP